MFGIKTTLKKLSRKYTMSGFVNPKERYKYLNKLGHSISPKTILCSFKVSGNHLAIKDHVFVNDWTYLDTTGGTITLDENVHLAQRATVLTSSHSIGERPELRCGKPETSPTTIGKGSWIGSGAIILPGANVAPGCVIAAGAVVTSPTRPNGLYAGVPARRIRDLPV